ncbi:hypothetical protein Scep_012004 [Stephania cephalantha]|uniref:Chalcone-flavonone isomerase family protein n=1 Tax=Stephania cephalantha TaxID=152367 RepID=A0AAP0P9G9_9MAGN
MGFALIQSLPIMPNLVSNSKIRTPNSVQFCNAQFPTLPAFLVKQRLREKKKFLATHFSPKASSTSSGVSQAVHHTEDKGRTTAETLEYTVEPATSVKFPASLSLPGCSSSLDLLGTGYREKVFAIIGLKVYAAGLYANISVIDKFDAWKGKTATEIQKDSSLFNSIFQAPLEKSLQIVLVRDVDGKTFWDALDEAISPRIKSPSSVDESALSIFRNTFQGRPLKKATLIFLTWLDSSKMIVSISPDGMPSAVDATIESVNVTTALFDVFFGDAPVSPSLKSSVSQGLELALK